MDVPIIERLRPRKGRSTQPEHADSNQQTPSTAAGKSTARTPRSTTTSRRANAKGGKQAQAKGRSTTTIPSKGPRKSAVEKKKKGPARDATFKPDPAEPSDDEAESPVQQQPGSRKAGPETPRKRAGRPSKTPVKDGAYKPDGDESDDQVSAKPTRKPKSNKKSIKRPAPKPFVPIPGDDKSAKTHPPPGPGRNPIKIILKVKKPASPRQPTPGPRPRSASSDIRGSPNTFHTTSPGACIDGPSSSVSYPRPSPSPRPSPKWPKRPAPDNDVDGDTQPPKRPRSENEPYASSSFPKRGASLQPHQGDHLTIADADGLLEEITLTPRKLELDEIAALFVCLQEKCMRFSQKHFSFALTEEQQAEWPLNRLDEQKHRSFFNMAKFLVDANHCGWREFFTSPEHRVPFVHGVLGERFKHNIFKIPGFGLSRDKVNKLAEIDRSYIKYDAFVRNKVRAEYLEELKFDKMEDWSVDDIAENTAAAPIPAQVPASSPPSGSPSAAATASDLEVNYFPTKYAASLDKDATQLASHIMEQLELVLPPAVFNPLRPHGPQSLVEKSREASVRRAIESDLITLLKYMGGLSLSIRFAGIDGTLIRLVEAYPKGSEYYIADSKDNICVNADHCNATCPGPDIPATLRIYMTCWCRLEGVVPHGKDRLELEKFQKEHQDPDAPETFTWEEYEEAVFPPLPYELQTTPEGRAAVADLPLIPGTEWDVSMAQASSVNERRQDHVLEGDDDTKRAPGPERGCFVTYYNRIAPTNVYCAWTPKAAARPTRFPDVGDDDEDNDNIHDMPIQRRGESLEDAIVHAKLDRRDLEGAEDSYIGSTMDLIREYHLGEWLVASSVAGGLLAYVVSANRDRLSNHFDNTVASALATRLQTVPSSVVTRVSDTLGLTMAAARYYVVTLLAWAQRLEQRTAQGVRDMVSDLNWSVGSMSASLASVKASANTPTPLDVATLATPMYAGLRGSRAEGAIACEGGCVDHYSTAFNVRRKISERQGQMTS